MEHIPDGRAAAFLANLEKEDLLEAARGRIVAHGGPEVRKRAMELGWGPAPMAMHVGPRLSGMVDRSSRFIAPFGKSPLLPDSRPEPTVTTAPGSTPSTAALPAPAPIAASLTPEQAAERARGAAAILTEIEAAERKSAADGIAGFFRGSAARTVRSAEEVARAYDCSLADGVAIKAASDGIAAFWPR